MLVGTYVKERDNNRMKGVKTGVIFWSKVFYLFKRGSKGDLRSLYVFSYIHTRQGSTLVITNNQQGISGDASYGPCLVQFGVTQKRGHDTAPLSTGGAEDRDNLLFRHDRTEYPGRGPSRKWLRAFLERQCQCRIYLSLCLLLYE